MTSRTRIDRLFEIAGPSREPTVPPAVAQLASQLSPYLGRVLAMTLALQVHALGVPWEFSPGDDSVDADVAFRKNLQGYGLQIGHGFYLVDRWEANDEVMYSLDGNFNLAKELEQIHGMK